MRTALDELRDQLIIEWDKADEAMKEQVMADYKAMPSAFEYGWEAKAKAMNEWREKYTKAEQELIHETSEEIHKNNVKAADKMIQNLVKRVEKKIGTITDYSDVYTNPDNEGFMVINGYFRGEKGSCEVRSISAGGYNIQKRHIRVLVI